MAYVEKPSFTQPVPPHATVRTEKGERYACWTDRKGQKAVAPLLAGGKCQRTSPGRWYGVYPDHHGRQRKTPTSGSRTDALDAAIRLERQAWAVWEGRESPDQSAGKVRLLDWL